MQETFKRQAKASKSEQKNKAKSKKLRNLNHLYNIRMRLLKLNSCLKLTWFREFFKERKRDKEQNRLHRKQLRKELLNEDQN